MAVSKVEEQGCSGMKGEGRGGKGKGKERQKLVKEGECREEVRVENQGHFVSELLHCAALPT